MNAGTQGPASLLGRVIGGYRLVRVLGKGATGVVFLGERTEETRRMLELTGRAAVVLPDQAAVKVLVLPWQFDDAERAEFRKRFLREARTLQTLDHPNILPVLISGEDEATDSSYMVLPYISGGTLHERLASQGSLPLAEAAALLMELAAAVDDAHQHHVLHRDIKPGNILLDGDGHPSLADFSIARLLVETTTHLTKTGNALGTPIYMSPEALAGQPVGREADIYSLGMVLYEMVTGLRTTTTSPPAPARQLRPDLPVPAEAAILKALAKQPAQRFATAGALAHAFREGLANRWAPELTAFGVELASGGTDGSTEFFTLPPTISTGSAPLPPAFRWFRGQPLKTAALAALALVLVAGGALGGVLVHGGQASSTRGASSPQAHATHAATSTGRGQPRPTTRPSATAPASGTPGGQNPSGPGPVPTNPPAPGPTATATATAVPTPTFTPPPQAPPPHWQVVLTQGSPGCGNPGGVSWDFQTGPSPNVITCTGSGLMIQEGTASFPEANLTSAFGAYDANTQQVKVHVHFVNVNASTYAGTDATIIVQTPPASTQCGGLMFEIRPNGQWRIQQASSGCGLTIVASGTVGAAADYDLMVQVANGQLIGFINGGAVVSIADGLNGGVSGFMVIDFAWPTAQVYYTSFELDQFR